MKVKYILAGVVALSAAAIGSTFAAKSVENDALAISGATISLSQAVTAAEQHVGGKAAKAEYEKHRGQWMFDVEVVKDKKVCVPWPYRVGGGRRLANSLSRFPGRHFSSRRL